MRERLERLVLLPFTIGFVSESCIAIGVQQQPRRSQSDANPSPKRTKEEDEEDSLASGENMKNSFRFLGLPKPKISIGIHRLFTSRVSRVFLNYLMKLGEVEMDLETGSPTDVKHVTQIGLDGSASASAAITDPMKGTWDDLIWSYVLFLGMISYSHRHSHIIE